MRSTGTEQGTMRGQTVVAVVALMLLGVAGAAWMVWRIAPGDGGGAMGAGDARRMEIDQPEDVQPPAPARTPARTQPPVRVSPTVKPYVDPDPANWRGGAFSLKRADGILETSESSWSVKGGRTFMQAYRRVDGTLGVRFAQPFREFLPMETITLLRTRWILAETEKLRDALAISDEQWGKLRRVSTQTDVPVEEADRKAMLELLEEYVAAEGEQKAALAAQLVERARQLDAKHGEETVANAERIAEEVREIFSEGQLEGLKARYGR